MDIGETKQYLHQLIDEISDDALLKSVEMLVISEVRRDVEPMSSVELHNRIVQSEEDIKSGRVISQEDLERESENW